MSEQDIVTTTQEEAEVAQAATIRELKKKRQKQLLNNAELDLILQDLHKELAAAKCQEERIDIKCR